MTEFLHDILSDRENILTDLGQGGVALQVFLQKVRETPLDELDDEDKRKLVLLLLKQLQPYLSAANLSTSHIKNMVDPATQQHAATTVLSSHLQASHQVTTSKVQQQAHNAAAIQGDPVASMEYRTKMFNPVVNGAQSASKLEDGAKGGSGQQDDAILAEILENINVQNKQ